MTMPKFEPVAWLVYFKEFSGAIRALPHQKKDRPWT